MKVVGLITEYNPFHNGHLYHLNKAREITGADYVIVVMSGNFVQRGAPAIIDKYNRTQMALANGADLVLELPVYYSCGSAEYFASGAIALLDKLGVVDYVCFGSECGDIHVLSAIADIFLAEPPVFKSLLKDNLRQGNPFPTARAKALIGCRMLFPALQPFTTARLNDILSNPNNILGIEYLKALKKRKSKITAHTIKRIISGYHDKKLSNHISSASAIRQALLLGEPFLALHDQMPDNVLRILLDNHNKNFPILSNDFSALFHYKVITLSSNRLTEYLDVSPDIAARILNILPKYESFEGFIELLKTRQITSTRIRRVLIHILLDIRSADLEKYIAQDYILYFRVLGFKKEAARLMHAIKINSTIPIITKLASAGKHISGDALNMLNFDVLTSQIYHTIVTDKYSASLYNEYTQNLIIV